MAINTLQDVVDAAVELLPPVGSKIEFEAYKTKLYTAYPDGGRDAFAHMIKRDVISKELVTGANGKPVLMLSRKS